MERFWSVEEGFGQPGLPKKEALCEEEFRNTHRRTSERRFVVDLSFKESSNQLGESKRAALTKLQSVWRRLNRDASLRAQYKECLNDYLKLGHMLRIDELKETESGLVHYLPHHAVVKEDSTLTKLRVVFDASWRTSSDKSLNNILRIGPALQRELFEIVLRFRQHQYVLTGDVQQIYW
ncbi:PREDICTED: uncharacterized protein LOC105458843 [Wasmannia auropunctata]|uniref:uncharacterized protein LOC105458843 n=1 Tax=Wasmannia auropunctata TaxID=64793 RepID=UPI0005EF4DDA|nr:PREDICTED: uncharacterized protein LOC105458843 [Wasmannia auropunctata]